MKKIKGEVLKIKEEGEIDVVQATHIAEFSVSDLPLPTFPSNSLPLVSFTLY